MLVLRANNKVFNKDFRLSHHCSLFMFHFPPQHYPHFSKCPQITVMAKVTQCSVLNEILR